MRVAIVLMYGYIDEGYAGKNITYMKEVVALLKKKLNTTDR